MLILIHDLKTNNYNLSFDEYDNFTEFIIIFTKPLTIYLIEIPKKYFLSFHLVGVL